MAFFKSGSASKSCVPPLTSDCEKPLVSLNWLLLCNADALQDLQHAQVCVFDQRERSELCNVIVSIQRCLARALSECAKKDLNPSGYGNWQTYARTS
jgi:hypothetical protein